MISEKEIKEKSTEHLVNLRAVYQKNPELIGEFVKALRFDCQVKHNKDCEYCNYAFFEEDKLWCRLFCNEGLKKLDGLLDLVREDLPPAQDQIEVCITVSIGKDVGPENLPFVDDWIVRGKTPDALVKNVLDAVAGDMIEYETAVEYANSLANSKVALLKAVGEA